MQQVSVKITFPTKISKAYQVFFAGDLEQAINHVLVIKSITKDKQNKYRIKLTQTSLHQKEENLKRLKDLQPRANIWYDPLTHTRLCNMSLKSCLSPS